MSLTNTDIRDTFSQLGEAVQRANKALQHSDDLPPLDLAETMVEAMKLSTKLSKLADKVQRLSAPLFAGNGKSDDGAEDKPNARKGK